ncbi:hypothetical protein XH90_03655 [Bradyrhizobium sp. CCBAU 53338]|nr:hypothetical protein XH90_03655 [Bradyrhizobium sp. CCBAU 53338]
MPPPLTFVNSSMLSSRSLLLMVLLRAWRCSPLIWSMPGGWRHHRDGRHIPKQPRMGTNDDAKQKSRTTGKSASDPTASIVKPTQANARQT